MDRTSHQKERYRDLLAELIEEEGGRTRGARARAARRLGIDHTYVSKLLSGERTAGIESFNQAVDQIGIRREFFDAPIGTSYKDYLRTSPQLHRDEPYPALAEFLAGPVGKGVSAKEAASLRGVRFSSGAPTIRMYELLLTGIRERDWNLQEATASAEATARAEASAKAKGGRQIDRSKWLKGKKG